MVNGRLGSAFEFDGENDEIEIPLSSLPGDFTLAAWVYLTGDVSNADVVMGRKDAGSNLNFYQGKFRLYGGGVDRDRVIAGVKTPPGAWTHVAISRSGVDLGLYLNGSLNAQGTWAGRFDIQHIGSGNAGFLEGILDDVRIYDRALTDQEMTYLVSGL